MKKHLWAAFYSAALFLFTAYLALDTFLIPSVYQTDAAEVNLSVFETAAATDANSDDPEKMTGKQTPQIREKRSGPGSQRKKPSSSGDSDVRTAADQDDTIVVERLDQAGTYADENIGIDITRYRVNETMVYAADVQLSSVRYLRTALADNAYGKNVVDTTSNMAEEHAAILAINGDYYGAQERGYVIRNGILYRDTPGSGDVLCVYPDGSMRIIDPSEVSAPELLEQNVWHAFSFGPGLVENGTVLIDSAAEVGRSMASNPRTAIGITKDQHYLLVVSDGRTEASEGLSLYELALFMSELGVETAYNLDGGGSSTMVFNGSVVNQPTTGGQIIRERKVSDIIYVG